MLLPYLFRRCNVAGLQKISFFGILCIGVVILILQLSSDTSQKRNVINIENLMADPGIKHSDSQVGSVNVKLKKRISQPDIALGDRYPNCGLDLPCEDNSFPVYVYTGKDSKDEPKLCINGRYIMKNNLNGVNRGLNLAVIDSETTQILHVRNFDTFNNDDTQLEMFLEKYVQTGDILIIFTFDEASQKLSGIAKKMLTELGSAAVDTLKFRSSWYMISQKGIAGYAPFEKLLPGGPGNAWAAAIEERHCVPSKLTGRAILPDAAAQSNKKRRYFCSKNFGYGDFCEELAVDEPLYAAPLVNQSIKNHPIFSVPIAVIAGFAHHYVAPTLETLLRQPGLNPKMVTVYYMKPFIEIAELAGLFQFNSVPMAKFESYKDQLEFVFESNWEKYPNAEYMILIEEELILSPDYVYFMMQMLPLLGKDPTLYSISAWNDNGYKGVSSHPNITYRVEGFPGIAFLISKTTYVREMKGRMAECCKLRSWEGWALSGREPPEMVVPDVSRVHHGSYEGLGLNTPMLENLFNRKRVTNLEPGSWVENADRLLHNAYEHNVEEFVKNAIILEMNHQQLRQCVDNHPSESIFTNLGKTEKQQSFVLYFVQSTVDDYTILRLLCKCFGLFYYDTAPPRGLHKGMLRFTIQRRQVFLVGSTSPYYRFKPQDHPPLQ